MMSIPDPEPDSDTRTNTDDQDGDRAIAPEDRHDAIQVELETLRAENRRLREEYRRARTSTYRRTAYGLIGIGLLAAGLSLVVPTQSSILLALGGTGLFGGLLVYYLTPERLLTEAVPSSVISVHTRTLERLVDELGLDGTAVYVPRPDRDDVRLFVPQRPDYTLPDDEYLDDLFVVTDTEERRGIALDPTGEPMYDEITDAAAVDADRPVVQAVETLADSLVDVFELAESVETAVESGRVVFSVTGGLAGTGRGLDYPISSVLATGLAHSLETPVTAEIETDDDATHVVCSWESEE